MIRHLIAVVLLVVLSSATRSHAQDAPARVTFPSADGKTTLVGYLYLPQHATGRAPAVVMMHGRAGAYSSAAKGFYDASTLSRRHKAWGELWAAHGYVALTFLRARPDVDANHIGLQGWSNGGSATLATLATVPGPPAGIKGFNVAIALYPACGLKDAFDRLPPLCERAGVHRPCRRRGLAEAL